MAMIKVDVVDFDAVTVKDIKKKVAKEVNCPFPQLRLIHKGQQVQNHRVLSYCGIENNGTLWAVVSPFIVVKIDEDDYMEQSYRRESEGRTWDCIDDRYYDHESPCIALKTMIYNDLKSPASFDQLCLKYGLFYNGTELKDDEYITNLPSVTLEIKTKDGRLYYLKNERQIHEQRCMLLTFGYIRELCRENILNMPSEISWIIKRYLNKDDIEFKILN